MNAFFEHHQNNIRFRYRCFDRLLLNGCIQSFLEGARAQGFFWVYRKIYPVSRNVAFDNFTWPHLIISFGPTPRSR